jgi:hypothetical protein
MRVSLLFCVSFWLFCEPFPLSYFVIVTTFYFPKQQLTNDVSFSLCQLWKKYYKVGGLVIEQNIVSYCSRNPIKVRQKDYY